MDTTLRFVTATTLLLATGAANAPAGASHEPGRPASNQSDAPAWLAGQAYRTGLQAPTSVVWNDLPLRQALASLSRATRVDIVLDRRVDPDQLVTFSAAQQPLAELLEQLAGQLNVGLSLADSVAYVAPRETATNLRTCVALRKQELAALPGAAKRQWQAIAPFAWPDFSTPADALMALLEPSKISVTNADLLPHDLLATCELPPLPLFERLSLLLAQFGLTFSYADSGRAVTLVEMPSACRIERRYPGGKSPRTVASDFQSRALDADVRVERNQVVVLARVEDHEILSGKPSRRPKPKAGDDIEKLRIDRLALVRLPLGGVLENLAKRLRLDLRMDRAAIEGAGVKLDQLITVNVENATVDEMLGATLKSTGLTFNRKDRRVEVFPEPRK